MIRGDVWSEKEIDTLRNAYNSGVKLFLISKSLGRSYFAINSKAWKLDLKMHKFCSIEGCHEPIGRNSVLYLCKKHYCLHTRNYYVLHSDVACERVRIWRLENRNKYLRNNKKYYLHNRNKIIERVALWIKNNPAKAKEHRRSYKKNHIEETRLGWQNYRARKRGAEGSHTLEEWIKIKNSTQGICPCCNRFFGVSKLTKDHIMSLKLHGSNYAWNLQPLCLTCNSSKGKHIINYLEGWKVFHQIEFPNEGIGGLSNCLEM